MCEIRKRRVREGGCVPLPSKKKRAERRRDRHDVKQRLANWEEESNGQDR